MFKSNKAWSRKKSSSILMVSFFSIFLLSCSVDRSLYTSNFLVSNFVEKNESLSMKFTQNECDDFLITTKTKSPPTTRTAIESRFKYEYQKQVRPHLLTDICTPVSCKTHNHYNISNYNQPADFLLSHDKNNNTDKLITSLAANMADIVKNKKDSFGLSDLLGVLGFIFGFIGFYYARYSEISKEIDTYRREFWLKQVLFPGYISNLKDLIVKARKHYDETNGDSVELWQRLLPNLNCVRDDSILFNSYRQGFNTEVDHHIDNLEDNISNYAYSNNNKIDASILFQYLQSFMDEIFYMLDEIYNSEKKKLPIFAWRTIKKIFFIS